MTRFGETVEIETVVKATTGVRISFLTVRNKADGALRCTGRTDTAFSTARAACSSSEKPVRNTRKESRAVLAE